MATATRKKMKGRNYKNQEDDEKKLDDGNKSVRTKVIKMSLEKKQEMETHMIN